MRPVESKVLHIHHENILFKENTHSVQQISAFFVFSRVKHVVTGK